MNSRILTLLLSALHIKCIYTQPADLPNITAIHYSHNASDATLIQSPDGIRPNFSWNTRQISCLIPTEGNPPTTVASCRYTLNKLKAFPDYSVKQLFVRSRDETQSRPRRPHQPPYILQDPGRSDCGIFIESHVPDARAWFSFKEARSRAQDIIEYCQDYGGRGGGGTIGERDDRTPSFLWSVLVVGKGWTNDQLAGETEGDVRPVQVEKI